MRVASAAIVRLALLILIAPCTFVVADVRAGQQQKSPFLFIMIDAKTEAAMGEFPYDRAVLAKVVERAADAKARAVVLKFYLDQPKSVEGDRALAAAMSKIPVVLEACIPLKDDKSAQPNPLPHRFTLLRFGKNEPKAIGGKNGWIPIPELAERAQGIGFVDSPGDAKQVPIVEAYQAAYVKSLYTICIELAFNDGALITPGREMQINDKPIELDDKSLATVELSNEDRVPTVSFLDFINGKVPDEAIKDRVLIIGCDTAKMPTLDTPAGKIGIHRAFNLQLLALYKHFAAQ